MKLKIFTIARPEFGEEAFDNWHRQNPGVKINSKHICAHGKPERLEGHDEFTSFDRLYIFYETAEDVQYSSNRDTISENAQLEMCKDIAKAIYLNLGEMETYKGLKNAIQRRAYMMDVHNIPAKDADLVHEVITMMQAGTIKGHLPEKE